MSADHATPPEGDFTVDLDTVEDDLTYPLDPGSGDLPWTRWDGEDLPSVPKMSAVRRAYEAARDPSRGGLPDDFAWALATAVTDPAQLRTAITSPRRMPVIGGCIDYVEVDLYTPALTPMPTNHRAVGRRLYPAAGAVGTHAPLRGPTSPTGPTTTLQIRASDVSHVIEQATATSNHVLGENKLKASIADRGILMPVEVVHLEISHDDGTPPASLLSTIEGSSRLTNAHSILGLNQARETLYDLPEDRDSYRRLVNQVISESPTEEGISQREAARRRAQQNALIVRARVFIRYVPTGTHGTTFAEAAAAFVGMIHVEGPKPWERVGRNEAQVEAVLRALDYHTPMDRDKIEYVSGMLDPESARVAGFPAGIDSQAAYVLATILDPDVKPVVNRAIRDAASVGRVTDKRRAEVAAELALRPTRSLANMSDPTDVGVRATMESMASAFRRTVETPAFRTGAWKVTERSPQDLLDAALAEPRGTEASYQDRPAGTELAALAAYHLTRQGALAREAFGSRSGRDDLRSPHLILQELMDTDAGLRQLFRAIVDGRDHRPIAAVTDDGAIATGTWDAAAREFLPQPDGPIVELTSDWLRYELVPDARSPRPMPSADTGGETPTMTLSRMQSEIDELSQTLDKTMAGARGITDEHGVRLIDRSGWACIDVIGRLNRVRDELVFWDRLAQAFATPPAVSDDDDAE